MLCKQVFPSAAYLCRAFKAWPGLAWSSRSCPSAPLPGFTWLLHPGEGLNSLGLPPSDLRRERDWHASRSGAGGASCPRTPSAERRSPPWGQRWLRSDPVPVHLAPRPRAPREACDTSQSIDLCLHDHVSTVMPPTHGWQSVLCRLGLRKWCVIEVDA